MVFGVPLDLRTQQPAVTPGLTVDAQTIERWFFTKPHRAVIDMLEQFQRRLVDCLNAIATVVNT